MSKKNNKGTRRRRHEHDLQREKEAAQEIAKKSQKMEEKLKVTNTKPRKKVTGIRIRKNVTVKGIKVNDSDTKKKVKLLLKQECLSRHMDMNDTAAPRYHDKKMKIVVKRPIKMATRLKNGKIVSRKPPTSFSTKPDAMME
jgi:hypothetical protein